MVQLKKTLLAAALFGLTPIAVQAQDVLNILISNFDLTYDGSALGDAQNPTNILDGFNPANSDALTSVEFELNGVTNSVLTSPPDNLYLDFISVALSGELIVGSYQTVVVPPFATSFDLYSDTTGLLLRVDSDSLNYLIIDSTVPGADLFQFNFEATLFQPEDQVMPGGLSFDDTVLVSFTSTRADLTFGETGVSALSASGQLTITGTAVPEPGSLALLALGAAGMLRRRRNG